MWVAMESDHAPVALGDRSTAVGTDRVELSTSSLSEKRSTDELRAQNFF